MDPNKLLMDMKQMELAFAAMYELYSGMIKGGFSENQASNVIAHYFILLLEKANEEDSK